MNKIFILLSVVVFLFMSCETDFDVNAEWEEITVVYGLLDASTDTQYIKINKAYLGEGSAPEMAQISDSVNFHPNDLEVTLDKLGFNLSVIESITLDTTLIDKEDGDGVFAVDNNIIYRAITPAGFLTDDKNYLLTIKNIKSGNEVSATTLVIDNFNFSGATGPLNNLGFYNVSFVDSLKFRNKILYWPSVYNAEIYQLHLKFNYKEDNVPKSLIWMQPLQVLTAVRKCSLY